LLVRYWILLILDGYFFFSHSGMLSFLHCWFVIELLVLLVRYWWSALWPGNLPRAKARETQRHQAAALQNAPQPSNDSPKWENPFGVLELDSTLVGSV